MRFLHTEKSKTAVKEVKDMPRHAGVLKILPSKYDFSEKLASSSISSPEYAFETIPFPNTNAPLLCIDGTAAGSLPGQPA